MKLYFIRGDELCESKTAVLGSPFLTSLMGFVDVKQH